MSDEEFTADVQYIEPLEEPEAYGGADLLADLRHVGQIEGEGPQVAPSLAEALHRNDYTAAESYLPEIRDWFKERQDRYVVLDSGVTSADVPILTATAGEVAGLELVVSQEVARGVGGEVPLKVGGTGIGASAKITISDSLKLTCSTGESLAASISLPIRWERRAHPDNEDYNWLHIEIERGAGSVPIRFAELEADTEARALDTLSVDNRNGGAKAAAVSKSYSLETGSDFSIGLKIDAIGLDASLKVATEVSLTTKLEATLPAEHRYQVTWLGGPWGVRVTAPS